MNIRTLPFVLAIALTPAALAAETIDGTSQESYESSLREFVQDLDDLEKELFAGALIRLILDRYSPATGSEGFARLAFIEPAMNAAPRLLDGVTFDELRTEMDAVAAEAGARAGDEERAPEARRQAEAEAEAAAERQQLEEALAGAQADPVSGALADPLAEALAGGLAGQEPSSLLDADVTPRRGESRAEKAQACLQENVQLQGARIEQDTFGSTIAFTAHNDLEWALSGIRVQLVVVTEGRSVAWEESTHAISIPGGIEPGETRDLAFTAMLPNATPNDAQARVTVLDVADADKRQLVQDTRVSGWSADRSERICGDEEPEVAATPADPAIEEIAETVASCWNIGALSTEASAMEFDVGFELAGDGKPVSDSTSLVEFRGGSEEAGRQGYEVARRAVLMCGRNGIDVDHAGPVVLTFDGDGVRPAGR